MVKQPAMEPSEFTMSHEDFPALPGVPASSAAAALNSNVVGSQQAGGITNAIGDTVSFIYGHSKSIYPRHRSDSKQTLVFI